MTKHVSPTHEAMEAAGFDISVRPHEVIMTLLEQRDEARQLAAGGPLWQEVLNAEQAAEAEVRRCLAAVADQRARPQRASLVRARVLRSTPAVDQPPMVAILDVLERTIVAHLGERTTRPACDVGRAEAGDPRRLERGRR